VDLLQEPQGEWKLVDALQSKVEGPDVVHDLGCVAHTFALLVARLELEDIRQGCLRPLDLRTEHRFTADVHCDEQVRVRQDARGAIEPAKRQVDDIRVNLIKSERIALLPVSRQ